MKFSKKLLLTQAVALAATSAAYAADTDLGSYIASGNSVLAPMVSDSVNDFGVNNELYLLSQKKQGDLKDGVVYVNGRLNASVNWFNISPKPAVAALHPTSEVMNPGLDLAVTATKNWFTAFVDLSTNQGSNSFLTYDGLFNLVNQAPLGLGVFPLNASLYELHTKKDYDPNQTGIGLQQAYLMMGDLNKMPVYALVGRKYVDFGSFSHDDQLWKPLTNYFNQNVQNQVSVGFYDLGIHAAATVFRGPWDHSSNNKHLASFVATASYGTTVSTFGIHGGVSYTSNVNPQHKVVLSSKRTEAGILFADVSFRPVTVTANYAQTFKDLSGDNGKPHAWDVGVKVNFNIMNLANWASVNYSDFNLKGKSVKEKADQWLLGWNVAFTKNLSTTLQYGHVTNSVDKKYKYNFVNLGAYYYF